MKKTLAINEDEKNYSIVETELKIVKISKANMQIDGKLLYENFFKDLVMDEKLEIEVIAGDSLWDNKNSSIVLSRLKEIIDEIVEEINIKFEFKTRE